MSWPIIVYSINIHHLSHLYPMRLFTVIHCHSMHMYRVEGDMATQSAYMCMDTFSLSVCVMIVSIVLQVRQFV